MTIVMAENSETDSVLKQLPVPAPCQLYPSYNPDPELGLTPERSPTQQKKCVRFISPAKSKARRKMQLKGTNKPSKLAEIEVPVESMSLEKSSKAIKDERSQARQCNTERHSITNCANKENHLDTPELNTTLHLGSDILKLQNYNIDIVEAVKHKLKVSEKDRTHVKHKTYSKLNEPLKEATLSCPSAPIDVPVGLVVEQTEKQLTKNVKPYTSRPKPAIDKPTLSKFFKPKLAFHRSVSHHQHGYQPCCLQVNTPTVSQHPFEQHRRLTLYNMPPSNSAVEDNN